MQDDNITVRSYRAWRKGAKNVTFLNDLSPGLSGVPQIARAHAKPTILYQLPGHSAFENS